MKEKSGIVGGAQIHSASIRARVERLRVDLDVAVADIERLRLDARKTRIARQSQAVAVAVALVAACALVAGAAAPGTAVKGPFEVVDNKNRRIVLIQGNNFVSKLDFFSRDDEYSVATIIASDNDGYFAALTPDGKMGTSLGVDGNTPYVRLYSGGQNRVSLDVTNGKPFVRIQAADGHGAVELGQGDSGGGELRLAKPGGAVMVKADVSAQGVGRVETGPRNDIFQRGSPIGAWIVGQR